MIPDWETNAVYFSDLLPSRHSVLWEQLAGTLRKHRVPFGLLGETRDIWAKDFCPVQAEAEIFIKFRYRPDYLDGYEDLITDNSVCRQMKALGQIRTTRIVLDGGNVVGSRKKVVLTDKIHKENPTKEARKLQARLRSLLQVGDCIVVPSEPGDPIGHADGLIRFIEEDVAVVNDYAKVDPSYGQRLRHVLAGHGLHVEQLPYFRENRSKNGVPSAVGNYVNFLRIGKIMFVPSYGHRNDEKACRRLESLCPKVSVIPLDCLGLAREGGVLNCVAWPVKGTLTAGGRRRMMPRPRHSQKPELAPLPCPANPRRPQT